MGKSGGIYFDENSSKHRITPMLGVRTFFSGIVLWVFAFFVAFGVPTGSAEKPFYPLRWEGATGRNPKLHKTHNRIKKNARS